MILSVEDAGMNSSRLVFAIVAGCCFLRPGSLPAQGAAPFVFAKQYSANVATTTKSGNTLESKMYVDGGKLRSDAIVNGISMIVIFRPDLQKIYGLQVDRKAVTETPMEPGKYKKMMGPFGPEMKFEWVGSEAIVGVPCIKYKGTLGEGKVCFLWVDGAKQIPVKLAAEDGSYTVRWESYKPGPQDASLFEVPSGYEITTSPGTPGGAGP